MNMQIGIFNLLVILSTAYMSYQGFTRRGFLARYVFNPALIFNRKEYYRLITSGFLHANWSHLMVNMFSLLFFGSNIENTFGPHVFLLIYFGSIAGGSLLSLYLHRNHPYQALGASGGVCGVIFASIFLLPGSSIFILPIPIPIPSWIYAIVFILTSFFGMRSGVGNIGHDAHLGGALVGLAITTVLRPSIVVQSPVLYGCVAGLSAGMMLYCYKYPAYLETVSLFSRAYWRNLWNNFRKRTRMKQTMQDEKTIERLLEKISKSGMGNLTALEKRRLKSISKRRGGPAGRK